VGRCASPNGLTFSWPRLYRAISSRSAPRGTAWFSRPPFYRSAPGTFLLHFLASRWACWDATTIPRNAQTSRPSHRINTFAYANGAGTRRAGKRRKPLGAKALTSQTAPLAYVTGICLWTLGAFGPHPCAADQSTIRLRFYRNLGLTFRIDVPDTWFVKPLDSFVSFTAPSTEARAELIVFRVPEKNMTIDQAVDRLFSTKTENPAESIRSAARLGGRRAIKLQKTTSNQSGLNVVRGSRSISYYVEAPVGYYVVLIQAPWEQWAVFYPLFSQILSSIQFLTP